MRRVRMVTSIVLLKVERGKVNDIAEKLAGMNGISEVYSVGGRIDLVAIIRVKSNEDLADMVTRQIVKLEGIESTETLIAFRAYSRHDLEAMFSVGFDG
jgi:DNA-binding Lrp family transcriptional regulator